MSTKVWDIKRLAIVFGVIPISSIGGYGEDDTISVKQLEESFMTKVGADGTITRYATNNKVLEIKLKTMQTSILNALLSGILLTDETTPGGAGIMPLSILDLQGTTNISCLNAWITGPPESPFGKAAQEREWTFNGEKSLFITGGN